MRQLAAILWVLLVPCSGAAEESYVRAGEHPTFTRLVIDIQPGSEWDIQRREDGYAVTVENTQTFDTSDIFSRVPTSRIIAASTDVEDAELRIRTDCECHVTAFIWRPEKLVIDVNDGPGKPDSPFEKLPVKTEKVQSLLPLVPRLDRELRFSVPDTIPETLPDEDVEESLDKAEQNTLSALEKIVVESLARGASQGLLTPSADLKSSETSADGENSLLSGGHQIAGVQPGLLAHTSIDLGKVGAGDVQPAQSLACLSDSFFELSQWGGEEGFYEVIGPLRAKLTGELGEAGPKEIKSLAKAYLYFGFGREAKEILALDVDNSQERLTLEAIASIIDGDELETDLFTNQVDCSGASSFWGFISREGDSKKKGNRDAILKAFRNLPAALQAHLAPRLSEGFTAVGDLEAAEIALSIEEYSDSRTTEAKLARADLQSAMSGPEAKVDALANLAETDSRLELGALIEYFQTAKETGAVVGAETFELADIMRFENAGNPLASELAILQVEAYIGNRMSAPAFELLAELGDAISPDVSKDLETGAIIAAAQDEKVEGFLELAFSDRLEQARPAAQNAVAERLVGLGLAERATILLKGQAVGEVMMERRYLRAEAAIEMGDIPTVLESIAGLSTDRAQQLQSRVTQMTDNPNTDPQIAVGNDWRMGNWDALATGEDPLLQSVSKAMLENTPIEENLDEPLAFGKDLIAQSEQKRQMLDDILNRFSPVTQ